MFAVQLFSCVCYNQCWLWQRWDVSHSVMELVGESSPQTQPPPLMAGVRWGHTWYCHQHHHLWLTPDTKSYDGHHLTTPGHPHFCSAAAPYWWLDIAQEASLSQSVSTCVRGGGGWSDTAGRKHHVFLAQLQSAAKQPGGLRYKVQSGRKLFQWLIFCHLHLCPVYQRVTVYQCLSAQCHSVISRYGRADPG